MLDTSFRAGDNYEMLRCDQYAIDVVNTYGSGGRVLHAASFTGTQSQVSAVRAMLNSKGGASVSIDGLGVLMEDKYDIRISKLPKYRMANLVIRSKRDGLCIGEAAPTVRDFIMSDQIDTPMLEEWIPWVVDKLIKEGRVKPLSCYGGLEAYICKFRSGYLDDVVGQGLKFGHLKISATEFATNGA